MKSGLFAVAVGTILFLTACGGGRTGAGTPGSANSSLMAYVLNQGDGSVAIFNVDKSTGALTASGLPSVSTGNGPYAIAVTPNKQFAYVANRLGNSVSAYQIASNGALSPIGTNISTGSAPLSIVVDPSGRYVYTANSGDNTLSGFAINGSGTLTAIAGSPINLSTLTPLHLESSPTTNVIYVATTGGNASNNTIIAYTVNASSGALTTVGSGGITTTPQPYSFAIDATGKAAISTNQDSGTLSTFAVNAGALSTGSTVAIANSKPTWVTISPNGQYAYVVDQANNNLSSFTFDASTASLTANGSSVATGNYPQFVTVDPTGHFVYSVNTSDNTLSAFAIGSSGTLTSLSGSPFNVGSTPIAMVFVSF